VSGRSVGETDCEPVKQEPPGFPYPGEEIIHSSARNAPNWESGEDSWFCVSKPDEKKVHTFGERTHRNPYRLTIHTPLRGSVSFFVNQADATHVIQCMLATLADGERHGNEPSGEHMFNLDYYNRLISDEYEIRSLQADTDRDGGGPA